MAIGLNLDQLIHLPVETKSGQLLGKIEDIEINPDSQRVSQYIVKSSNLVNRLTMPKLIISPSQVVSLDKEKMVVVDSVSPGTVLAKTATS